MKEKEEFYTLNQVCEILDVTRAWLKKVVNRGLVRGVRRAKNHYRLLNANQLEFIRALKYLSQGRCDMRDLKIYAELEYKGEPALETRKAFLETKRRQIWEELDNLRESIDYIERKIETIDRTQKS